MTALIFASNNVGKLKELQAVFKDELVSYRQYSQKIDVGEVGTTYRENAYLKAKSVAVHLNKPVIGDDGGLELLAHPDLLGVETARFFDINSSDTQKNQQILRLLTQTANRQFVLHATIVYYHPTGLVLESSQQVTGEIALHERGTKGYGFDPILFIPKAGRTLGEMSDGERQQYSPRIQAMTEVLRMVEHVS